jgi:hypothetical protein
MVKLPDRNVKLTEEGGMSKCCICLELIEEDEEMTWFEGRPAHESCAWMEENT